ncbi:MAG: ParB/RepB/Spo0J family partition protein [Phycisphaerales bacterium]|nr:ParB/RepB/Spo0J family partition protein [Phycisphaerales bacterium]
MSRILDLASLAGSIHSVKVKDIVRRPQVRDCRSQEDRLVLAQSIAQNGIYVPLIGHWEDGQPVLDDGYGRLEAAESVGFDAVPMILTDRVPTPAELITLQLVVNTARSDLTVMEKSRAYARLMQETGWSAAEMSVKLGKPSPSTISKLLTLQLLPKEVQDLADAGRLPMSSAYAIATIADAAERARLVQGVIDGKLTRDQLVAESKIVKSGRRSTQSRQPRQVKRERVLIRLGEGRSVSLSAPSITAEDIVSWLTELAERIRSAGVDGRPLADIVAEVSCKPK